MLISRQSELSGNISTRELAITQEQLEKWQAGALIQHIFPDLSPDDREWLRSGITEEEWKGLDGEKSEIDSAKR